jgi:tetratricopeptide (TPR) repeat protein
VKDVLPLLRAEQELERQFIDEVTGKTDPAEGWSPAMAMFHVAQWRERLSNALTEAAAGRPVNAPTGNIDELNDAEMAGAAHLSLADEAARADAELASLIAILDTTGEQPFKWYAATTNAEAIVRNSYLHARIHLADQFRERGDVVRSDRLFEETASQLRKVEAPGHILGAALFNLASVRATQGRSDEALTLLEEALPMRPDLRAILPGDPEFAALRESPRFRTLLD